VSPKEPNLQNIPIRSKLGREIRRGFFGAQSHVLIDADYSQIELRILRDILTKVNP
jgi:DNA polymerase-1